MKRCYLTVLSTDDYLVGVLVLNESLKAVNAAYPLCCLTAENLKPETYAALERAGIKTIVQHAGFTVSQENIDKQRSLGWGYNWQHTFFKLYMFGVPYEKIVYLDADCMVIRNVDELFDKPHLSACKDCELMPFGVWPGLNSGVMVIEPDKEVLEKAIPLINGYKDAGGDQAIFGYLYPDWEDHPELKLPRHYNVFMCYDNQDWYFKDIHLNDENTVKIAHLTGKPFLSIGEKSRWVDRVLEDNKFIYHASMYKFAHYLKIYKKYETEVLNKLEIFI